MPGQKVASAHTLLEQPDDIRMLIHRASSSWIYRRRELITANLPWLSSFENNQLSLRLTRLRNVCGCSAAVTTLLVCIPWSMFRLMRQFTGLLDFFGLGATYFLATVGAAVLVKTFSILVARFLFLRDCRRLLYTARPSTGEARHVAPY